MGCRGSTVKTPWESRLIPTPDAVATATYTADDGHEVTADLYGKGHLYGEPHRLVVVAHPRIEADGPVNREVTRHPTFPEVIDAADLLAPGGVFDIRFVACPAGVEREAETADGALGVQANQVGEARMSPLLHMARS